MDLLKLFETLENKVDEATKELEKTKISSRKLKNKSKKNSNFRRKNWHIWTTYK